MLFDQLVVIGSAGADFWTVRAVLHDGPIGAHFRARAVERDRDIGYQMGCPGPLISCLTGKNAAKLRIPITIVPGGLTMEQVDALS